jgi:hypothetical protein
MKGGIFKNKNEINVNNYVNFTTKLKSFRKKDIANKIYKQILEIYNKSALKKYNDSIGFIPELKYSSGDGNWEEASYEIVFSSGLYIEGILNSYYYQADTGFDEYIKGMRQALDIDNSDNKDKEKIDNQNIDSNRLGNINIEDLENKIENLPVICIPKFNFEGNIIDKIDIEIDTHNSNFKEEHNLYSKSDLLNDLNEIGLFLISNSNKNPIVDLNENKYKLYTIEYKSVYTGYRKDGTSYEMELGEPDIFGSEHRFKDVATYYVMAKDNENIKDAIKRIDGEGNFNLYDTLFSTTYNDNKDKHDIKQIERNIKEIKNAKLDINFFNYLKRNYYKDNNVKPSKIYSNIQWEHENRHVQNKNGVLFVKNLK